MRWSQRTRSAHRGNPLFSEPQQGSWILRHPRWSFSIAVVLLAGCTYGMYGAPLWQLQRLEVQGTYTLPVDQIRLEAKAQMQARWLLFFQQNGVWSFDTKAFERRLRARWIFTELKIARSPFHTLRITLQEELPTFLLPANGVTFGISSQGIASAMVDVTKLGQVPILNPAQLPNTVGLETEILSAADANFLRSFAQAVRERDSKELAVKSITLPAAPDRTAQLVLAAGWSVIVDRSGDATKQLEAFLLAYDQKLVGKSLEYVNVTVPARVYYK